MKVNGGIIKKISKYLRAIEKNVHLKMGDILIFEAASPHLWRNPFDTEAKFILVLQTPMRQRACAEAFFKPSVY